MAETIKIAVCDDEKNIRSYLVSLIKKQGGECGITEYASADAYLSDGKEHDIIFLDIEMGGSGAGMDGMGLARHIRGMEAQKQPIIIFVTGYEKYVYDAFDVGAFQYLVKPVDEQKFAEVFGRAAGQIVSETEQRKKKLVIQYGGAGKAIPLNDIYLHGKPKPQYYSVPERREYGIVAALFILANIGIGFLPCTAWVRYGVSAFAIMGYAGICYKKQIGKAVFVMLAFYNIHCLGYLMASSIYEKVMSVMMKSIDFLQDSYLQEVILSRLIDTFSSRIL